MVGDHARFRNMVDENGGLLPWKEGEWTWRHGQDGASQGGPGDSRDNRDDSVTGQRAALTPVGRMLQPGEYVSAVRSNQQCVRPGHLVVATLKECQALRGRGPSPLGPGDVWSVRQYLCGGVATAEQLAEACGLRPEFIAAVAEAR